MPNFISEEQIELRVIQHLQHLHGFDVLCCMTKDPEDLNDTSGRASKRDVILVDRVRESVVRLNHGIPELTIDTALERFENRHAQKIEVIKRDNRLENIAKDITRH